MKKLLFYVLLIVLLLWATGNNNQEIQHARTIVKIKDNQLIKNYNKQNNQYFIETINSQNKINDFNYYYSYKQNGQEPITKNENCYQNEEIFDEFLIVYYKKDFSLYPLNLLNINEKPDWQSVYQLKEEELWFLKNLKIKITKIIEKIPGNKQDYYDFLWADSFFYENIQQYLLFDEIKGFLTAEEQSKWDQITGRIEQKNNQKINIKGEQNYWFWLEKLVTSSLNNWQKGMAADLLRDIYLLKKLNDCEQIWADKSKEILFLNYERKYKLNVNQLKAIMEEYDLYLKEGEILAQLTQDKAANQLLLDNNRSFLISNHLDYWQDLIYYQQINSEAFIKITEEEINYQLTKNASILKIINLLPKEIVYWPEETIYQTIINLIEQHDQQTATKINS